MKGAPIFQPGKLPLTNFRIVLVETDTPGGGIGILGTWGTVRDIRRNFFVIAEMEGAEFDVTHFLSEYITPEIKRRYNLQQ